MSGWVGDAQRSRVREWWGRHRELIGYLVAGAAYIALGFFVKQVFAWWSYGAIFAVVTIWGIPRLWRTIR